MQALAYEMNLAAAKCAREAVNEFKAPSNSPNGEPIRTSQMTEHSEFYADADPSTYKLLKEFVSHHRKNPTEAENVLWSFLRNDKLNGNSFRRQHIIGNYIIDFVCLAKKLIIEVDGLHHQLPDNKLTDESRTLWLNSKGYIVLRFTNNEVLSDTENTLLKIKQKLDFLPFAEKKNYSRDLPPLGEQKGAPDYMGAFAVTIHGAKKFVDKFAAENDEYNKILVQILADRFVEAFAECLHEQVRKKFWGYAKDENLTSEQLIKEEYKGIRPAPGYPACPDHTEKIKLFELLNVTENIGIELTESLAMNPPASVCGWYIARPQSHYFGLGKIGRDQLEDYAKRKGMSMEEAERWLRPVLE